MAGVRSTYKMTGVRSTPKMAGVSSTPKMAGVRSTPKMAGVRSIPKMAGVRSTPKMAGVTILYPLPKTCFVLEHRNATFCHSLINTMFNDSLTSAKKICTIWVLRN